MRTRSGWLGGPAKATATGAEPQAGDGADPELAAGEKIIDCQVNLSVAMRTCELRYCDNGETTPQAADARIGILDHLLGLSTWQ